MTASAVNPEWLEQELYFDFSTALRAVCIDDRKKGGADLPWHKLQRVNPEIPL